jgi:hypothetical protein
LNKSPYHSLKKARYWIRIKAFGLNRSELFARQGHSPNVKFPRIMGIEASGIVETCRGHEFTPSAIVVTAMGLGRDFDGGYAEFTCIGQEYTGGQDRTALGDAGCQAGNATDGVGESVQSVKAYQRSKGCWCEVRLKV